MRLDFATASQVKHMVTTMIGRVLSTGSDSVALRWLVRALSCLAVTTLCFHSNALPTTGDWFSVCLAAKVTSPITCARCVHGAPSPQPPVAPVNSFQMALQRRCCTRSGQWVCCSCSTPRPRIWTHGDVRLGSAGGGIVLRR